MGTGNYRGYGWFYTLVGVALFVGGVASVFDTNSRVIHIGGILVGPVLFARGVYLLREFYRIRRAEGPPPRLPTASTAEELYAEEIRNGRRPKDVTCESCSEQYVYFPGKAAHVGAARQKPRAAAQAATVAEMIGRAVAPCPWCGRVQADMTASAEAQAVPVMLCVGAIVLCLAALCFAGLMSALASANGRGEPLENAWRYWTVEAVLVVAGTVLVIWGWMRARQRDPNAKPPDAWRDLAERVSLRRSDYLRLSQAPGAAVTKGSSEAIIGAPPAGPEL